MTVARFAISFDYDLAHRVRDAAGDQPISTWLAEAAASRLRAEGLHAVVRDWEAEHGAFTAKELATAARKQRGPARTRK